MRMPLSLLAALLLATTTVAQAGLDQSRVRTIVTEFNQASRAIRPGFLEYPGYTLHLDDESFSCLVPMAMRRLAQAGERFTIRKVHTKRDHFRLELATSGKRRFNVMVYDRGELTQDLLDRGLPRLLHDMFEFGPAVDTVRIVGNLDSRMIHHDRCNHLPPATRRQVFSSREDAATDGYRECPICFGAVPNLPFEDYISYRTAGLEAARRFELVYPLSTDAALQREMARLGNEVLDGWPLDLAGFDYEFRVVRADQPLAVSFATGIIVISDTMLKAAEAPEEILFVLAHEIAHCELHQPPRSPFATEALSPLQPGFAAFLAWARDRQMVADMVAISWFRCQPEGRWQLARARVALAKIQQAVNEFAPPPGSANEAYSLYRRLWLFEPARYSAGDLRRVFVGRDGDGDVRYEVRPLGFLMEDGHVVPHFLLSTTDYQDKSVFTERQEPGGFRVDQDRYVDFVMAAAAAIPGHTTLLVGKPVIDRKVTLASIATITRFEFYGLPGVKEWVEGAAD